MVFNSTRVWVRIFICVATGVSGFALSQSPTCGIHDANAAALPNIGINCNEILYRGYGCTFTNLDTRSLSISQVILNNRENDETCIKTKDDLLHKDLSNKLLHTGDAIGLYFDGSCGKPVMVEIFTNVGGVHYDIRW
jgi:hypothetical protein